MFVAIKDVRNSNYGEGLIFHLFSLNLGLAFLVYLHLKNPMNLSHTACRNIGKECIFIYSIGTTVPLPIFIYRFDILEVTVLLNCVLKPYL